MTKYVRKNLLTFRAQFVGEDGVSVTPSVANVTMVYQGTTGAQQTRNIPLELVNGFWTGTWDSSDCKDGRVEWVAYCEGAIQAATQGAFDINANKANTG